MSRSVNSMPVPATRSRTVCETTTSLRACLSGDAGTDGDGEPSDLTLVDLAFADVDPDSCFEADRANAVDDPLCCADRAGWPVEGREEAVAGAVALLPAEAAELAAHDPHGVR